MTVLFFSDSYRPYVSGVVTSMDVYAEELRKLGHRVVIVAPDYPDVAEDPDVFRLPSMPLPAYPKLRLIAPLTRRLIKQLLDLRPSVVHAHSPFAAGLLGLYIARAAECPAVFTCHSIYEEYTRYLPALSQPLKAVVRKYLVHYCGYCQLILAPSPHMRDFLIDTGVSGNLEVLPTGVDSGVAHPPARRGGRSGKAFVIALVGRLAKEKNMDLALLTMFHLAQGNGKERDRWRLLIVGDGPESERLHNLAVELGIKSLVTFLGEVPREQVFHNLRLADCLIFTSTIETQGLVMLEAMSMGLPVVAADSPAATALLNNGCEGFIAPPEPEEMARAISRLAADRPMAARMGAAAATRSREYQPSLLARRLADHYAALLAGGSPQANGTPQARTPEAGIPQPDAPSALLSR
ncbi:MAG: glycosyltransferase [Bacillota bacterium]|nr:glycosyltransferase [Bacillota bacterium]